MLRRFLAITAITLAFGACKADTEPANDTSVGQDTVAVDTTTGDDTVTPADGVPDTADAIEPDDIAPAETTPTDVVENDVIATTACAGPDDCQHCTWTKHVATASDCYCPICPVSITTVADCAERQAEWTDVCTTWANENPCPVAICLQKAPPLCDDTQTCVADIYGCRDDRECMRCVQNVAPTKPEDCKCSTCGTPMTQVQCDDITAAVEEHCLGLLDDCPDPSCAPPPDPTCGPDDNRCH